MSALANPKVGKYINKFFVSSFQKVGTFRIVGRQKQGGNVASYFCAPDGRVLHVVAGPVNAEQLIREAKWVIDNTYKAMKVAKNDGAKFKAYFRKAHSEKLRREHGLVVQPVTFDPAVEQDPKSALTYRDPSGRPIAPKLPPVPIHGPDVQFHAAQKLAANLAGARAITDMQGRRFILGNQGRVHQLLAAHSMKKIETIYATVFERILGERVSTEPVQIVDPFPWRTRVPTGRLPHGALNGSEAGR
ncbi:MAG: hypothetical protein ACFCD0_02145 [Gemmataceae bacterium]